MPARPLALVALLVPLCACSGIKRQLEQAHELAMHKDFTGAAKLYQSALIDLGRDEAPSARDARAMALKALGDLNYLHLANPAEAARCYRDLAERYPEREETFEARAHLADILHDQYHDTRAALEQLAALVQSFPNHLDTDRYQYLAAQDYFALRDYAQTETEVKLLLQRYPGTGFKTDAQMLLAGALALEGRRAEAIERYTAIAKDHPGADAGRANFEIGRLYEESGDWEKAETSFARAMADHPEPQVVSMALQRVKRRVAMRRPVDIHDHDAVFDHKNGQKVAESGD
ncbi:MAG: tetratricopeptide repeat protein [Deltaproteobacteria bacterium]|nr:tetratricopeptide repeat protein [Deltaproteobacteria bacterium]